MSDKMMQRMKKIFEEGKKLSITTVVNEVEAGDRNEAKSPLVGMGVAHCESCDARQAAGVAAGLIN